MRALKFVPFILLSLLFVAVASQPAAAVDWDISSAGSRVTLIGSEESVPTQSVPVGAAAQPDDWRTLSDLLLPTIDLAFDEFLQLEQQGEAAGSYTVQMDMSGLATLDLNVKLTDSSGGSVVFTVGLTTEPTNGNFPDGSPVCTGGAEDPSVCEGSRRDPVTGAFRLVGIAEVPAASGTIVDQELLLVELEGVIPETVSDADDLPDFLDNCPTVSNPGQEDIDLDGLGDACDDCTDRDDDGFGSPGDPSCPGGATVDCNDFNGAINPGATELCDNIDNDCNVSVDEATCADFDVDGNMTVDGSELARLALAFGQCSTPPVAWWAALDFDRNDCIDGADLAVLSSVWACSPGPICE